MAIGPAEIISGVFFYKNMFDFVWGILTRNLFLLSVKSYNDIVHQYPIKAAVGGSTIYKMLMFQVCCKEEQKYLLSSKNMVLIVVYLLSNDS